IAHATLDTVRGPLSKQLSGGVEGPSLPAFFQPRKTEEYPSSSLPFLELPYFNGLGGFSEDGREYAIYLGPEANTPLPWINVIANPIFGTLVSESGPGCTWFGNSQTNRLSPWNNDPIADTASEAIYI